MVLFIFSFMQRNTINFLETNPLHLISVSVHHDEFAYNYSLVAAVDWCCRRRHYCQSSLMYVWQLCSYGLDILLNVPRCRVNMIVLLPLVRTNDFEFQMDLIKGSFSNRRNKWRKFYWNAYQCVNCRKWLGQLWIHSTENYAFDL